MPQEIKNALELLVTGSFLSLTTLSRSYVLVLSCLGPYMRSCLTIVPFLFLKSSGSPGLLCLRSPLRHGKSLIFGFWPPGSLETFFYIIISTLPLKGWVSRQPLGPGVRSTVSAGFRYYKDLDYTLQIVGKREGLRMLGYTIESREERLRAKSWPKQ